MTSISFCWGLATKLFLLFTFFFFLGTYAYHNLNKQIHKNKNKNLSEPLKNSQLFNGINSLGFHKNSLGLIFVSESCHGFTTTIFIFNEKDCFFIASYDELCEEYNCGEMVGSTYWFY